jgi:hypothetical protein
MPRKETTRIIRVDYFLWMCKRLRDDPTSVSDFQRRKPKFRIGSRRNPRRLEVHYIEKRLNFWSNQIRIAKNAFLAIC